MGISEFVSRFRRLGQNLRLHTKFRQIRTIRGDITILKIATVIVTSSLFCRKTEFNALES